MKILNKIILLAAAIHGRKPSKNREIGILFRQKFNKNVMFYRMLFLEFSSKENLRKCSYSNGIPGHPKVLVKENPAWHKQIKGNNVHEQCKKICDRRDNCAVFAVNKKAKLAWITFVHEKTVNEIFRLVQVNINQKCFNAFLHVHGKALNRKNDIQNIFKRIQARNRPLRYQVRL